MHKRSLFIVFWGRWMAACLFAMMTCFNNMAAQPVSISDYKFLNQDDNKLLFCGNAQEKFVPFFRSWRSLVLSGGESIHIIHVGDSHLQADLFSGQTRFRLQTFLSGLTASRGMVAPFFNGAPDSYKIKFSAGWQNSKITDKKNNYKMSWWGTTAFCADSIAKVEIQVNFRNPIPYHFQTLRIYHSPLPKQAYWEFEGMETTSYLRKPYRHKEGYSEFIFDAESDTVICVLHQPDSNRGVEVYGFYFANQDAGMTYSAVGINGADLTHYLKLDRQAYEHLASLQPQMLILSIGTNDAYLRFNAEEFKTRYGQWISKIRNVCPDIPVILTTPADSRYRRKHVNPRMAIACQAIKEVAKQYDCAVWDLYEVMGGKGASSAWIKQALMQRDCIHFTTVGYQLQGDLFYNALWKAFDQYITAQNRGAIDCNAQ